jgi:hypothetical protein
MVAEDECRGFSVFVQDHERWRVVATDQVAACG